MKRVVTNGDLTQQAMRPADLQERYLAHVEADVARFELTQQGRERGCPACGGEGVAEFQRLGFRYHRCRTCRSLFVSPLPDEIRLARYHAEGDAERFWREQMLPGTADVRARYASGPRARWVLATAAARLGTQLTVAQWGQPAPSLANLLQEFGSSLITMDQATSKDGVDAVIAFDVLERSSSFAAALQDCRRVLRPGGLLFITTMSGDGLEVRILGPRTRSLVPPVHLQLLSRAGWIAALSREGFRLFEYSTPGELDVQAVADVCRGDATLSLPPVLDELIRHEDDQVGRAFQELLQQAGLSTHVQLVAEAGDARAVTPRETR